MKEEKVVKNVKAIVIFYNDYSGITINKFKSKSEAKRFFEKMLTQDIALTFEELKEFYNAEPKIIVKQVSLKDFSDKKEIKQAIEELKKQGFKELITIAIDGHEENEIIISLWVLNNT